MYLSTLLKASSRTSIIKDWGSPSLWCGPFFQAGKMADKSLGTTSIFQTNRKEKAEERKVRDILTFYLDVLPNTSAYILLASIGSDEHPELLQNMTEGWGRDVFNMAVAAQDSFIREEEDDG